MDRPEEAPLIRSLRQLRSDLAAIVRAAVAAAHPAGLLARALAGPARAAIERPAVVVAAGKAAAPMVRAFAAAAGSRLRRGVAVGPGAGRSLPAPIEWVAAGHPLPDEGSEAGGRKALALAAGAGGGEQVVVLLSGGASALLAVPIDGVTIRDKIVATRVLLESGADIGRLNCVRKHLSAIKGGRLAAAARQPVLTLAISDVVAPVPDDPSVIGSGPSAPDPSTFGEALEIVRALPPPARTAFPGAALGVLERGARGGIEETPKPGDPRLADAGFLVVGSRVDALQGARRAALALGYRVITLEAPVTGEAREAAARHTRSLAGILDVSPRPVCVLSAGETTVTVTGPGRGGRNQEFALGLAIAGLPPAPCVAASIGTDGIDGPTDAAGAVVDSTTLARAAAAELEAPRAYLDRNDVLSFFEPLGDLVRTGPTGTNVGDLQVVLAGAR